MNLEQLKEAGFTEQEIGQYVTEKTAKLRSAGFQDEEINAYFGKQAGGQEETALPAAEEKSFQSWYAEVSKATGLNPNPDDPEHYYDYRAAWKSGIKGPDETGHWPSIFKREGHPRMVIEGINTKTGMPVDEPAPADLDAIFDDLKPVQQYSEGAGASPAEYKENLSAALWPLARPFVAQGYNALAASSRGFSALVTHLDSLADYASAKTGIEKTGILEPDFLKKVADYYDKDAKYWGERAQAVGINFIDELVSEAVGGGTWGISEFMMGVPYAAGLGAAEAYKKGENEIAGALVEGAKRGVLGKIFHAIGPMKTYLKAPVGAAVFGAQAAAEGAEPREIAKAAGTGFIYMASSPGGRMGLNEIKNDLVRRYVETEARRIEPVFTIRPTPTIGKEEIVEPGAPREAVKGPVAGEEGKVGGEVPEKPSERFKEKPIEDPEYYYKLATEGKPTAAELGSPPTLIMTGGPTGAGKSSFESSLERAKSVFINVNSDIIKEQAGQVGNPKFHELSSNIAKEIFERAENEGYNIFYDSILANYGYAKEKIENFLKRGGEVKILFTNVEPDTSVVRSTLRQDKTGRVVPENAILEGYNRALPTFLQLWKEYRNNPNVFFELVDNNVDFQKPREVFINEGGKLEVIDRNLFDKLTNLDYIKNESGKEVRYERREKATPEILAASRGEINRRISSARLARSRKELRAPGIPEAETPAAEIPNREGITPPPPGPEPDLSPKEKPPDVSLDRGKFPVERIPVSEIQAKPEMLQFKLDVNAEGEQKPLKGEWNELAAGNLLLWQDLRGNYYVANGHHRLALAKRLGVDKVNAQILRQSEGYTIDDARRIAAEANILGGKGTIFDQAEYFRTMPEYTEDLSSKKGLIGAGYTIGKKATDNTYAQFRARKISPEAAEAISEAAPQNDTLQVAGVKYAIENPKADPYEITNFINALTISTGAPVQQGNLFGFNDQAIKDAELQAKAVAGRIRGIRDQINAVRGAAKRPEIARKLGVDVKDPQAVKNKIAQFQEELARWEKWFNHPDLVEQIRSETGTARKPAEPAAAATEPAMDLGPALLKMNPRELQALKISERDARILRQMEKENPEEFARILRGNTAAMILKWEEKRRERAEKMREPGMFEKPAEQPELAPGKKQIPQMPEPPDREGGPFKAEYEPYRLAFLAWEESLPKNQPIVTESERMVYVISPDPKGGWRATAFDKRNRMPFGHDEFETRLDAVWSRRFDKVIEKVPFQPVEFSPFGFSADYELFSEEPAPAPKPPVAKPGKAGITPAQRALFYNPKTTNLLNLDPDKFAALEDLRRQDPEAYREIIKGYAEELKAKKGKAPDLAEAEMVGTLGYRPKKTVPELALSDLKRKWMEEYKTDLAIGADPYESVKAWRLADLIEKRIKRGDRPEDFLPKYEKELRDQLETAEANPPSRRGVEYKPAEPYRMNLEIPADIYSEVRALDDFLKIKEAVIRQARPGFQEALFFKPKEGFRKEPEAGAKKEKPEKEPPMGRAEILRFLQETLEIPIRTGRIGEKALGIFKPFQEVIRTKNFADIEAISHEVGHALHKYLWPETFYGQNLDAPFLPFASELRDLSSHLKDSNYPLSEGFAEFIRTYITNPTIGEMLAPDFTAHFEKMMREKAPESLDMLLRARDMYEKYQKQPAQARVRSQISINEDRPKEITLDDIYTLTMDEFHPLKTIERKMAGEAQPDLADSPYHLARLFNGSLGKANAFLRHSPFKWETFEDVGKSLQEILKPIEKDYEDFVVYSVCRRIPGLLERGIDEGISLKDAEEVVRNGDAKFAKTFSEVEEYRHHLFTYLKDSGILSQEAFDKIIDVSKDYVGPFYKVFEETGKGAGGMRKGLQAYQPVKEIKGSWDRIQDPIEGLIKDTILFTNLADRNAVGQAMVRLAEGKEGLGKFMEEIPTPVYGENIKLEEIFRKSEIDLMKKAGIEPKDFYTVFRPSAFTPRENVISVWIDGEQRDFQVTPEIYRTFRALDREGANSIEKLVSYPAKWLRAGSVLTPEFIGRNPIRDQFTAFINSRYGFIPGVDLIRGIFHLIKKDDIYWKWQKSGGAQSTLASMDREYFQQELGKILQDSPVLNLIKNPVEALRVLGELGEVGTRLGEFAKGLKKEGTEKAGIQAAGFSSREISTDFQRIGAKTRAVNGIISFWNANLQGLDREIRAFRDNPLPATLKAIAAITLPSLYLAWANHDDPRYQEIPQWQKDLFWIIIPDHMSRERWDAMSDQEKSEHMKWISGSIWRIPKPWELGIVFGTIPERVLNYILDQDPEAWNKIGETIWRTAAPGVIPTFLVPWLENRSNYSFFFDRKVVPASREDLPPKYQYAPYTTEAAKKLGEILGKMPYIEKTDFASPAKIENLVRGWTGGLGYYALQIVSEGLTRAGLAEEGPPKPTKSFADIPFVKAFAVRFPQAGAESVQDFWDHYKEAAGVEKAIATMSKEFKYEKAIEILVNDYSGSLKGYAQAIGNLHDMVEMVWNHPDMKPEEKREFIDICYFQMIAIAKSGNDMIKDMKKIMEENRKEQKRIKTRAGTEAGASAAQ